jgi:hypothetical protein
LFFNPEIEGGIFLRKVGWHSTDFTALYCRRWTYAKELIDKRRRGRGLREKRRMIIYSTHAPSTCLIRVSKSCDRLGGLEVRLSGYRSRGPEFDSRPYQIFWEVGGLERGPLSLVRTIEELLEWKSRDPGLENRD